MIYCSNLRTEDLAGNFRLIMLGGNSIYQWKKKKNSENVKKKKKEISFAKNFSRSKIY